MIDGSKKCSRCNFFKRLLLTGILFSSAFVVAAPPHVLTFFVKPYPYDDSNKIESIEQQSYRGIFFTYFGSKVVCDNNGQVTFTVHHEKPHLYMLITASPEPVFMLYNTIHHWQVASEKKYSFFSITRSYDEMTQLHFWSVEQVELQDNFEIPLNTIVVHADPDSIFVPTGITVTNDSPQWLLPQIYVKQQPTLAKNALEFLENCQFFAPTELISKNNKHP